MNCHSWRSPKNCPPTKEKIDPQPIADSNVIFYTGKSAISRPQCNLMASRPAPPFRVGTGVCGTGSQLDIGTRGKQQPSQFGFGSELIHPLAGSGGAEKMPPIQNTCASAEPGGFTAALNRSPSMAGCRICNSWSFFCIA